ncbi:DUF6881 domain-containing protein [Streptomyces sp. NPDC100445]|uniref:DUF6881 domain-containing protein n=1 Tax=Streptomyces sp. NPDC100445 TaxID=3366102 RepID=UPI0038234B29
MEYWKVEWLHDFQEEPTRFYNEIGHDGYEVRKIQHYRDGRRLKADASHESSEIGLSEIPVGTIEDVASQPEFAASLISREEFEQAWESASWSTGVSGSPGEETY